MLFVPLGHVLPVQILRASPVSEEYLWDIHKPYPLFLSSYCAEQYLKQNTPDPVYIGNYGTGPDNTPIAIGQIGIVVAIDENQLDMDTINTQYRLSANAQELSYAFIGASTIKLNDVSKIHFISQNDLLHSSWRDGLSVENGKIKEFNDVQQRVNEQVDDFNRLYMSLISTPDKARAKIDINSPLTKASLCEAFSREGFLARAGKMPFAEKVLQKTEQMMTENLNAQSLTVLAAFHNAYNAQLEFTKQVSLGATKLDWYAPPERTNAVEYALTNTIQGFAGIMSDIECDKMEVIENEIPYIIASVSQEMNPTELDTDCR